MNECDYCGAPSFAKHNKGCPGELHKTKDAPTSYTAGVDREGWV